MQEISSFGVTAFEANIENISYFRNYSEKFSSKFDSRSVEIGMALSLIRNDPSRYRLVSWRANASTDFGGDFGFGAHVQISSNKSDFLDYLSNSPFDATVFIISTTNHVIPHNNMVKIREQLEPFFPIEPLEDLDYGEFGGNLELVTQGKDGRFHTLQQVETSQLDYSDESPGTALGGVSLLPGSDFRFLRTVTHFQADKLSLDFINGFPSFVQKLLRENGINIDKLTLESDNSALLGILVQVLRKSLNVKIYTPQLYYGYSPSGSLLSILQVMKQHKEHNRVTHGILWIHVQNMGRIEVVHIK